MKWTVCAVDLYLVVIFIPSIMNIVIMLFLDEVNYYKYGWS